MTGDHALIVLAAGGSTRLGRPKQLLTRDGEPLVRRALRLGLDTQPRRAIVVLGADHAAIAPALDGLHCTIALHAAWRDGLGASLRAGAAALGDHRGPVLILVCDQPALAGHQLQALLAGAAAARAGCAATLHDGRPGVPAVVPVAMLDAATDAGATGDRDADAGATAARASAGGMSGRGTGHDRDHGLAPRLRAMPPDSIFALDAPALALDIDTPDDLHRAIALGLVDGDAGERGTA